MSKVVVFLIGLVAVMYLIGMMMYRSMTSFEQCPETTPDVCAQTCHVIKIWFSDRVMEMCGDDGRVHCNHCKLCKSGTANAWRYCFRAE